MTLAQMINTPCTILRRSASGSRNKYGGKSKVDTPVETVCELQQRRRDEQGDQGELSDTFYLAIFPAGTEIRTGDGLVVAGHEYEMIGDPWRARNPRTQAESHIEATVRRTAGDEDEGS